MWKFGPPLERKNCPVTHTPPDSTAPQPGTAQNIEALVQRLPHEAALNLYEEIERKPATPGLSAVHRALVDRLNGARRAHARRQFTQIFEDFLTRNVWQLRENFAPPGAIHVLDIGGLWAVLAAKPLYNLAKEADNALAAMAQSQPLAIVLRRPDAVALRERMRRAAIDFLKPRLHDRIVAKDIIDTINLWRRQDALNQKWNFVPRPLTITDLTQYLAILESGHRYTGLLTAASDHDGGGEAMAALMAFDPPDVSPDNKELLARLVPLVRLNQKRAYDQLVPILVQSPPAWQPDLLTAMVRHLSYICATISDGLCALTGNPATPGGAAANGPLARRPLALAPERQSVLERELSALDTLLSLLEEFDMLREGRDATLARDNLSDMIRQIETALYPYLTGRLTAVTGGQGRALPDEAALVWVLDYIMRWRNVLTRTLHWGTHFSEFRDRLVEDLTDAFKSAFTEAMPGVTARDRLGHAVQAAHLAAALGANLPAAMTLLDGGVVTVATERLRDPTPITPDESLLLGGLYRLAVAELKRIRHWQDPALSALVKLGEDRQL